MSYDIQQSDIDILGQHIKNLKIKMVLLNENTQPIDILQGDLISGDITISATDDIRRSATFTFALKNKSYIASETGKIWFDKYIDLYLGILNMNTQQVQYYPIGLYVFNDNTYTYNSTTNQIEVKCKDFMYKVESTPLYGTNTYKILAGTIIRDAMISAVTQLAGCKKYLVGNVGSEFGTNINNVSGQNYNSVPYDLSFSTSDSVYSIISKLRDLYSGWETFYDEDIFICQQIPTGTNESIILDWETIEKKQLLISESRTNSFDKVKNITQVFGKQITADRYTATCTNTGSQYNATFTDLTALESGKTYAVKLNVANLVNPTLKINSLTVYPIVDTSGVAIPVGKINGYSAFKFYNNQFMYLGQYRVCALTVHVSVMPDSTKQQYYKDKFNTDNIAYVTNPDSPYTVEKIGERIDVKSGSDYDSIYSQDLACQRGKLENWKTTRMEDSITLELQLVPWLTVNKLISYKSKITNEVNTYIIKNISIKLLDGVMTVDAIRYYPLYPNIT